MGLLCLLGVFFQNVFHVFPEFRVGEGKSDIGFDKADVMTAIIVFAIKTYRSEILIFHQAYHSIGELYLSACALALIFQNVKNFRLKDITP